MEQTTVTLVGVAVKLQIMDMLRQQQISTQEDMIGVPLIMDYQELNSKVELEDQHLIQAAAVEVGMVVQEELNIHHITTAVEVVRAIYYQILLQDTQITGSKKCIQIL
jgi:hypothetical protein